MRISPQPCSALLFLLGSMLVFEEICVAKGLL